MRYTSLLRPALALPLAVAALAFGPAARAQMGGAFEPGTLMRQGAAQAPNTTKAPAVQPPALPGATSKNDAVAPATRIPTDMSPNDALFDAINRGDIGAARDALNRGAQLNARNILGMTPLELSVDLGRNDISFLLLSFRDADESSAPASQTAAAALQPGRAEKPRVAKHSGHPPVVKVKATTPPAPPETPHLFAGNGGTPVPSDGFLGFNTAPPAGH